MTAALPSSRRSSSLAALFGRAVAAGSTASVASLLALVWGGHRDCNSALAPVNAVSHWLWRDVALRQQGPSLRYSVPGYLIHHSMSVLWAVVFEGLLHAPSKAKIARAPAPLAEHPLAVGLGVSALACFVDLRMTPERLTPGFERRLEPGSLTAVYLMFGLGLALPRLLDRRSKGR